MKAAETRRDFLEKLSSLHELTDEAFERERKRLIEEEISKYPPHVQDRLRKFQWTLDMKRKKCKNPLEACFMFHEMLMEQVYGENGLLENLQRFLETATQLKNRVSDKKPTLSPAENRRKDAVSTKVFDLSEFARLKASPHGKKKVFGN